MGRGFIRHHPFVRVFLPAVFTNGLGSHFRSSFPISVAVNPMAPHIRSGVKGAYLAATNANLRFHVVLGWKGAS